MPKIHWPQFNKTIEVKTGTSILDAALDNDIPLNHACGGFCACTTCHVHVKDGLANLSFMADNELERIENVDNRVETSRLGCQAQVLGDITLEVPQDS